MVVFSLVAATASAGPFQGRRRGGYSHGQEGDPSFRLYWDQVSYRIDAGTLTSVQQRQLEASLRKWCKCPVRRVQSGGNLSIRIQPFERGGVCITGGAVAKIIVDPSHPDGFQAVMDHEVHHLVEPYFHPED